MSADVVIPISFEKAEECEENQGKVTITNEGNDYVVAISGGVDSLNEWEEDGETHKWIALDVDTGMDDITIVKVNGNTLSQEDVEEATAWGLSAGHFLLWIKADEASVTPETIVLSGDDKEDTTITISVEDANG